MRTKRMKTLLTITLAAISMISCAPAPKKQTTIQQFNHAVWSELFNAGRAPKKQTNLTLEQLHYEMEHQPGMDVIKGAEAITNYRLK